MSTMLIDSVTATLELLRGHEARRGSLLTQSVYAVVTYE
jgi:hypothetical protein